MNTPLPSLLDVYTKLAPMADIPLQGDTLKDLLHMVSLMAIGFFDEGDHAYAAQLFEYLAAEIRNHATTLSDNLE